MLVVGGIGVSLAVLSDAGSLSWSATNLIGMLLALGSALCTALATATAPMLGRDQRHRRSSGALVPHRRCYKDGAVVQRDHTDVSVAGNTAATTPAATPFIAAAGVVASLDDPSVLWAGSGLKFAVAAGATHMAANHPAATRINTLYYLTPVGALLLLAWLADTTIEQPDLLIVGAATVVVVNMVLHVDREGARQRGSGHSYQTFVLALWTAAAVVSAP